MGQSRQNQMNCCWIGWSESNPAWKMSQCRTHCQDFLTKRQKWSITDWCPNACHVLRPRWVFPSSRTFPWSFQLEGSSSSSDTVLPCLLRYLTQDLHPKTWDPSSWNLLHCLTQCLLHIRWSMKAGEVNKQAPGLLVPKGSKQNSKRSRFESQLCQFLQCGLRQVVSFLWGINFKSTSGQSYW